MANRDLVDSASAERAPALARDCGLKIRESNLSRNKAIIEVEARSTTIPPLISGDAVERLGGSNSADDVEEAATATGVAAPAVTTATASRGNDSQTISARLSNSGIKLPKFEILHFYGDPTLFLPFEEDFTNRVHNAPEFNNLDRMQLLVKACQGDASGPLSQYRVIAENYIPAWEAIK